MGSSPAESGQPMRTQTAKRILLSIAALVVVLGLIVCAGHRPGTPATIQNPKFRLLTAKIGHGRNHKVYRNGPLATSVLKRLAGKDGGAPSAAVPADRAPRGRFGDRRSYPEDYLGKAPRAEIRVRGR